MLTQSQSVEGLRSSLISRCNLLSDDINNDNELSVHVSLTLKSNYFFRCLDIKS